jgi:DNA adenine methylase
MPMICATRKFRPAIKCHGGKAYLARRIIAELLEHDTYVEPFAGGLSVLLNLDPALREVACDINPGLMGFYAVLRDRTDDLLSRLAELSYCAETFAWSLLPGPEDDPIETVARFLVRNRFSRGGLGKDFAWSERLRGGQPGDLNGWMTILRELPRIARRLASVELRCQDALGVIAELDSPDVLFYLDPPYHHTTRTDRDSYAYEMDDAAHRRLLDLVVRLRGSVAISGYANPLYDEALRGWRRVEFNMPNHAGQTKTKQRRVEVLWLKP